MPIRVSVSPAKANTLSSQVRKRGSATDSEMTSAMVRVLLRGRSLSTDQTALCTSAMGADGIHELLTRYRPVRMDSAGWGNMPEDAGARSGRCRGYRRPRPQSETRFCHRRRTSAVYRAGSWPEKKSPRHGFVDERDGESAGYITLIENASALDTNTQGSRNNQE